ncbi:MAG: rhodanese-like domain-containing protein [Lachnospiraceae bacterium]|nr:rhodanese-like domain-containing protein [Lachnospiraceae bacterium]
MNGKKHICLKSAVTRLCGPVILCMCLVSCARQAASPARQESATAVRTMSAQEAASLMEEMTDYIVVDVRREEEYAEGHIPDAINVPLDTIGEWEIAQLPDRQQTLFVYCRSGVRSEQAAARLAALGYTDVIDMGGITDWPGETVSGISSWAREKTGLIVIADTDTLPEEWEEAVSGESLTEYRIVRAKGTSAEPEAETEAVSILYHNDGRVRGVRVQGADGDTYNVQCDAVLLMTDADPSLYAVFRKDDRGLLLTDAYGALDRADGGGEIVPTKCGVKLKVPEREKEEIPEEDHYSYGVYACGDFATCEDEAEGEEASAGRTDYTAAAIVSYIYATGEIR